MTRHSLSILRKTIELYLGQVITGVIPDHQYKLPRLVQLHGLDQVYYHLSLTAVSVHTLC